MDIITEDMIKQLQTLIEQSEFLSHNPLFTFFDSIHSKEKAKKDPTFWLVDLQNPCNIYSVFFVVAAVDEPLRITFKVLTPISLYVDVVYMMHIKRYPCMVWVRSVIY